MPSETSPVRTGLIGAGIGPSLSPALHEREARELGVECRYERFDLDVLGLGPADVGGLLARARDEGLAGVNVTHPVKQAVIAHLDEWSADAIPRCRGPRSWDVAVRYAGTNRSVSPP